MVETAQLVQVQNQNSVSFCNMSNVLLFTSWLPDILPPEPRTPRAMIPVTLTGH